MECLSLETLDRISNASLDILKNAGVLIRSEEAKGVLKKAGCSAAKGRITFPPELVEHCISEVPASFKLFAGNREKALLIGDQQTTFNPGSAAIFFKDHRIPKIRKATLSDMENIVHIVEHLEYIEAQSTAVIPSDINESVSDLYRLYVILKSSEKPIVTGAFSSAGFQTMRRMLEVVSGGSDALAENPRAIFDCCPSSPLLWEDAACQNLIDCARHSIPAEIIPAPIMGGTSPVSLYGTLVQTNAEILSGIVIAQLANPEALIVYGCATSSMDMKYGVPRFGSAESILVATASSEIGKHYGLPTHAYLGTTDSKTEDSQGGFESGIGLALAALTGINVVSGPGMTTQLNCQSLEKLVIDNEICGLSLRLKRGIDLDDADIMVDLIAESTEHQNYLKSKYTMKRYRSELQMPSEVICRLGLEAWKEGGMKDSFVRARDEVDKLLEIPVCQSLSAEQLIALDSILRDALVKSS